MKFFIPTLLMAAASLVLAAEETVDCATQIKELTESCMVIPTKDNVKEICKTMGAEKCQNFYNDPFSVATACKDDATAKSKFNDKDIATFKYQATIACTTDGDGKECPVNKLAINDFLDVDNSVKKSCYSKACSDALNVFFDKFLEIQKKNEKYENMKKELNSSDCTKQQKNDVKGSSEDEGKSDDTSDARLAAKIGGSVLLSLLLSLFLF